MAQIDVSSVPVWARPTEVPDPATVVRPVFDGRSQVMVGIGATASGIVDGWAQAAPNPAAITRIIGDDADAVTGEFGRALTGATVGVRVLLAGPAGACLRLRGLAVIAGLADDEITVIRCGSGPIEVHCAHCAVSTTAVADVDDLIECIGCSRQLLVYHHVSRRSGRYLGFAADAETGVDSAGPGEERTA